MENLDDIGNAYGALLKRVDAWFAQCVAACASTIACCQGCSSCCRGLFDITLLDAWYLRKGFDQLPLEVQEKVRRKASKQLAVLRTVWPEMAYPYILNVIPERQWERLMPNDDETPCVLLGEDGACLVYDYRPMTCRLYGIPLVDTTGELMHDEWCTKNFVGEDPLALEKLRWDFTNCFREELSLFQSFMNCLLQQRINEMDTFIPTAVFIDFSGTDWRHWWSEFGTVMQREQGRDVE